MSARIIKRPWLCTLMVAVGFCFASKQGEACGMPHAIKYTGGSEGRVIFDHQLHLSKGARCNDCHTDFNGTGQQLFATRRRALISSDDHSTETGCFACHDGKVHQGKAKPDWAHGSTSAFYTCERCHYPATSVIR